MISDFSLPDLLSGKLMDRNWELMEPLAKLEHLLLV